MYVVALATKSSSSSSFDGEQHPFPCRLMFAHSRQSVSIHMLLCWSCVLHTRNILLFHFEVCTLRYVISSSRDDFSSSSIQLMSMSRDRSLKNEHNNPQNKSNMFEDEIQFVTELAFSSLSLKKFVFWATWFIQPAEESWDMFEKVSSSSIEIEEQQLDFWSYNGHKSSWLESGLERFRFRGLVRRFEDNSSWPWEIQDTM